MAKGGYRTGAGRRRDETSGRSEANGFTLTALPAEGYAGEIPPWPLVGGSLLTLGRGEDSVTIDLAGREAELWEWAWRTPQACAWSMLAESWRIQTIARWVRVAAICEQASAPASMHMQLHRYADQIGFTTGGLAGLGWKVAQDETQIRRAASGDLSRTSTPASAPARRLRAAGDAQ